MMKTDEIRGPAQASTRRQLLIGGALLATAGITYARMPRTRQEMLGSAKLDAITPKTIGAWRYDTSSGLVLPPQDELRDSLYNDLLTRVYTRGQDRVMLLIAYSSAQDGVLQVHRPEVCYPASGYALRRAENSAIPLPGRAPVPGRFVVADGSARIEQIVYWVRLGNHFPTSWSEQRLAVVEDNLHGIIPDGVLVRVSAAALGDVRGMLDEFAGDLYRLGGPALRRVLTAQA